jgi:hypothetical protein
MSSLAQTDLAAPQGAAKALSTRTIQRVAARNETDCLRCCVAMVTGVAYEKVPDFVEGAPKRSWTGALRNWLSERGSRLVRIGVDLDEAPQGLPVIAIGKGNLGCFHAMVVLDGQMIDPAPIGGAFAEGAKYQFVILPAESCFGAN